MAKLVWPVRPMAAFVSEETTEVEVARIERAEEAGLADLGLRLGEARQVMAAIQAEIVPPQATTAGEYSHSCAACGRVLASKGHYTATFRSVFAFLMTASFQAATTDAAGHAPESVTPADVNRERGAL